MMDPGVSKLYGDKVRVRICGLCWQKGELLMVNHRGLRAGDFWAPPGGGLEFGQSVGQFLQKEFPGKYKLEEYYNPDQMCFKYRLKFDTEADEMWFKLKYG